MATMHHQMNEMYKKMHYQQAQLEQALGAVAIATAGVPQHGAVAPPAPRAPDLPKIRQPSSFHGAMGFSVDDWLAEFAQQFAYYGARFPDDASKVHFAVAFLTGPAMHWWASQPVCVAWDDFVQRLHGRFRPVHAAMLARQKLGKLRQRPGQSVNQFVGLFQNTLTPIVDMGDMDQVHHFVNGLLGPIASKVWEKHPQDLVQAIDAAVSIEAMSNFGRAAAPGQFVGGGRHGHSSSSGPSPDAMDLNNLEQQADIVDESEAPSAAEVAVLEMRRQMSTMAAQLNALSGRSSSTPKSGGSKPRADHIAGLTPEIIKKLRAEGKCFRCKKQGHMKGECPDRSTNL